MGVWFSKRIPSPRRGLCASIRHPTPNPTTVGIGASPATRLTLGCDDKSQATAWTAMTSPKSQQCRKKLRRNQISKTFRTRRFSRQWNRRLLLNQASQSSTVDPDLSTNKKAIRFTAFSPRLALPRSPTLSFPIPHIHRPSSPAVRRQTAFASQDVAAAGLGLGSPSHTSNS
jgi:hypothetical protein